MCLKASDNYVTGFPPVLRPEYLGILHPTIHNISWVYAAMM